MAKKSVVKEIDPAGVQVTIETKEGQLTEYVKQMVRDFAKASDAEKEAQGVKENAIAYLRKYVSDVRDKAAKEGDYQKTFRVLGSLDREGIRYAADVSQVDKFSMTKDTKSFEELRELISEELFNENFEKVLTIKIKNEFLKDDVKRRDFTKVLVDALGVEGLRKYFEKGESYEVKSGLDQRLYSISDENRDAILKVAKPSSDSVKNASYPLEK